MYCTPLFLFHFILLFSFYLTFQAGYQTTDSCCCPPQPGPDSLVRPVQSQDQAFLGVRCEQVTEPITCQQMFPVLFSAFIPSPKGVHYPPCPFCLASAPPSPPWLPLLQPVQSPGIHSPHSSHGEHFKIRIQASLWLASSPSIISLCS